jgi:hypothetical protein
MPNRWEDSIKIDLHKKVWGDMDSMNLTKGGDR